MYRFIRTVFLSLLTQIAFAEEPPQKPPKAPDAPKPAPKIALSCGTLRGVGKIIIVDERAGTVFEIVIHCLPREASSI